MSTNLDQTKTYTGTHIVEVRKMRNSCEGTQYETKNTAREGIRVFVKGRNIRGKDSDILSAYTNDPCESDDANCVMEVLIALSRAKIIKLKVDDEVKAEYFKKSK